MAPVIYLFSVLTLTCVYGNEIALTFEFKEEQNAGTIIGNVAAKSNLNEDFTAAEFKKLTYTFFKEGNKHANKFRINAKTSSLSVAEKLDREVVCPNVEVCELIIGIGVYIKQSSGLDNLIKIIQVTIILTDINDNTPTFSKDSVTLEVPESVPKNHILHTSGAIDPDTGSNAIQSYSMVPANGMFELQELKNRDGSSDLGIVIKHQLDRESKENFHLKIIAKDGGDPPLSGSVDIHIVVLDDNDNKPQFLNSSFNITIPEDFPVLSTIVKLEARDPDSGDNGKLEYSFNARTSNKVKEYLGINVLTGDIFPIKKLNYEQDKLLHFRVDVRDKGNPSRSAQASVTVRITDVNDNAPQLKVNLPPSSEAISESAEMGSFVAHVSVYDSDSGANGEVSCETTGKGFSLLLFSDFAYIFKILLEKPLNYEEAHNVTVNVTCKDHGKPPKYNSTSFTFNVGDENDNPPVFSQDEYRVAFTENNSIGEKIYDVKATDADSGLNAKIEYQILNLTNIVSIDRNTGRIRAQIVFDRESISEYIFTVKASDSGNPSLSAIVNVVMIILDQNDHPPLFTTKLFNLVVLENQQPGTYVGRLNATDADDKTNKNFEFSFAYDADVEAFSIDPHTGFIKTTRELNREKIAHYNFNVIVTDKKKSSFVDTASVMISVLDDNDNAPVITYPNESNKTVSVPYSKPPGTILLTVQASDQDSHDNAKLSFSINKGNDKNIFMINSKSGDILIARTLNANDADTYPLVVAAHDNGGKREKSSLANLNIIITGGNSSRYGGNIGTSNGSSDTHNMAIVITLIIVTVVLAIAVLVTICIIRKIDRERRIKENSKIVELEKACEMQKPFEHLHDIKSSDSEDNEIEKLKMKIKNDLSFSVNDSEPNFDNSSFTNVTSFTTFTGKNLTSYSSIEQKMLENPQACSSVLSNNTMSPDGYKKQRHYPDKKKEINRLSTDSLRPYRGLWLQDQKTQGMAKISEDLTSEISGSTETSERDSGRGGSEEDIHPHSDSASGNNSCYV